jgi:hypothetical protein
VTEQLWNHPVPIYIEINPAITIGAVTLNYRSLSDASYETLPMTHTGAGYAAEIPCTMLQPAQWLYYISVSDPTGNPLTTEGASDRPFTINMNQTMSGNPPTRPGGGAVPACGPNGEPPGIGPECVPGMPCATEVAACVRSCVLGEDCLASETCSAGCCRLTSEMEEEQEEEEEQELTPWGAVEEIGLWVHLGLGLGIGAVTGNAKEPLWFTDANGTWYGPDDARNYGGFREADRQEVPVSGLAVSGFVARFGIGYDILPFLSLEANVRMNAPMGDEIALLGELRLAYWFLTGPQHHVSAFVGGGGGVATLMVPDVVFHQTPGPYDPDKLYSTFYKPAGFGEVAFGGQYRYNFTQLFGVGAELAMNVFFPAVAFTMDILADVSLSF